MEGPRSQEKRAEYRDCRARDKGRGQGWDKARAGAPAGLGSLLVRLLGGLALADAFALQLAAGGHDVAPARRAHRARIARIEDDVAEGGDGGIAAALEGRPGPGIEGDEVDLGRHPLDQ